MIRHATIADMPYIDSLQKKFSEQIAFLPRPALVWYLERQCVRIAIENGDPIGYVLSHWRLRWCPTIRPIIQAAVQLDARRLGHASLMIELVSADALHAGQRAVQANCVEGPELDPFWVASGFLDLGYLPVTNVRRRNLRCWRRFVAEDRPADLIMLPKRHGMMSRR